MASIMKNDKQEKALVDITRWLNELQRIDAFVANVANGAQVGVTTDVGKKRGVEIIPLGEKESERILTIMASTRAGVVKNIKSASTKFSIQLSEEEKAMLKKPSASAPAPAQNVETASADEDPTDDIEATEDEENAPDAAEGDYFDIIGEDDT